MYNLPMDFYMLRGASLIVFNFTIMHVVSGLQWHLKFQCTFVIIVYDDEIGSIISIRIWSMECFTT